MQVQHKYSVETMSLYTRYTEDKNMLTMSIIAYIQKMFKRIKESNTYGSELETYIVSKNPQSTYDVEYWTAQYDKKQNEKGWLVWKRF